jgi:O-antigen/teichoic acid export membrane protein
LALLRARELVAPYFWIRLCGTGLQLVLGTTLIPAGDDPLVGLAWGYASGSIVALLLSIHFVTRDQRFWLRLKPPTRALPLVAFGFPLLFHDLGSWLRSSADPFLLARFASLADVSIYSLASMSGLAIALVGFSFDLAYAPFFYRMLKDGLHEGRKRAVHVARVYLAFMGIVVLVPVLFAPEIYSVLVPAQYSRAALYAPVICLGYLLFIIYTVEIKPLFFQKKTKLVPLITIVPTALGVAANYALLPHTGMGALPWVWVSCFALMATAASLVSRRYDPIRFGAKFPVLLVSVLLFLVLAMPTISQLPFPADVAIRALLFFIIAALLAGIAAKEIRCIRMMPAALAAHPEGS